MPQQPDNANLSQLKQLWGEFLPPLTPEQAQLSVQLWQKIQARKQRQPQGK
jgi:hypothetical protein